MTNQTSTTAFLKQNVPWLSAGALLTFYSSFGQTYFISLFAGEIQNSFALTAGSWGLIYAVGTLASAAVMVRAGSLADRFRTRHIGSLVLLGLALSCMLMALNSVVPVLIIVIFLLRFFGQGMASHVAVVAMSRWFVATRGRALAVCALGFTVGEALFPILVVALLNIVDWRLLWVVASLAALFGIPVIRWLLLSERHPSQIAKEALQTGMGGQQWTRDHAIKHPLFWCMVPALLGVSAFNTAFFFHQVHYAAERGWSHFELVAFFPLYTVVSVAAMVVSGRALDRFGTASLIPFYQVPMIAAFILFAWSGSYHSLSIGLILLALSSGANATLPSAFWAEFYGTQHIGSIKAMATAIMVLGSAIGPGLTGVLLDAGYGLNQQYFGVSLYFAFTTSAMMFGVNAYRDRLR